MNSNEKELFRRALSVGAAQQPIPDQLKERIAARIARRSARQRLWSNILSTVGIVFAAILLFGVPAVFVPAATWSSAASAAGMVWESVRDTFGQTGITAAMPHAKPPHTLPDIRFAVFVSLTVFGYGLLALWIDIRRAARRNKR